MSKQQELDKLIHILNAPKWKFWVSGNTKANATLSLSKIGPEAIPSLIKAFSGPGAAYATLALYEMGGDEVVLACVRASMSNDDKVHMWAEITLEKMGVANSINYQQLLDSEAAGKSNKKANQEEIERKERTGNADSELFDICVITNPNKEVILRLAETAQVEENERILGFAKATISDTEKYFCKDKNSILSSGDVVYINTIDGTGEWVEILDFTRFKTERKDTNQNNIQGIQLYNNGVSLYSDNAFGNAIDAFNECYDAGIYQMQAVYAISLCQQALGVDITIPDIFENETDTVGSVFIASNLVCKLINDGYNAALVGKSDVLAIIDGSKYDIRVHSFLGSFMLNAWRVEEDETIPLSDSSINPYPTHTDKFVISLVQDASSLPPYLLPDGGLPSSLE